MIDCISYFILDDAYLCYLHAYCKQGTTYTSLLFRSHFLRFLGTYVYQVQMFIVIKIVYFVNEGGIQFIVITVDTMFTLSKTRNPLF